MKTLIKCSAACFLLITSWTGCLSQTSAKIDLWSSSTQLRGANIHQRRIYTELDGPTYMGPNPVGPPYRQESFNQLAALGANYVNISHPGLFTEKPPYILDNIIQTNLDTLLARIQRAGMKAVISFRTGPGRSEFTFFWDEVGDWFDTSYLNDSIWQDAAAQSAWPHMWQYTAQRYGTHPAVVGFDLMVEPNANEVGSHAVNDLLDIWEPDEFERDYGGTLYDWNQLYPQIITAIRQINTDMPILVGGMGYSAVDWLSYLKVLSETNIVYTFHQYQPNAYTHQLPPLNKSYPGYFDTDWDGEPENFNRQWLISLMSTVDDFLSTYQVPVAVNEFGLMRWQPNAAQYMDDIMALFEERGLNHALWLWESDWEARIEQDDFNFLHGPDPANHSQVNRSDLIDVIKKYWSRNKEINTHTPEEPNSNVQNSFVLYPPFPNPFNPETTIQYTLPANAEVKVEIYNIMGHRVRELFNRKTMTAGRHKVLWNGLDSNKRDLPSGVYIYQITVGDQVKTNRCLLLK
ncbi:cellulase family glycosylhydrolase [bacterium]|nr:cellulase family glycosylhydrolase [bacterium]